jgi:S1-C subfamily serine protease
MVLVILSLSFWLAGFCGAAECPNQCTAGLVGTGPVKHVCPICEGAGEVPDSEPVVMASNPKRSLVRVIARDGVSSGVVVGPRHVLGAWHAVRLGRHDVLVRFQDQTEARGRVTHSDDAFDLALIEVPRVGADPVPVAPENAKPGETVTILGYGGVPSVYRSVSGRVTTTAAPTSGHPWEMFEARASVRLGDSGGPILNERGELAGILGGKSYDRRTGHLAIGTAASQIRRLMESEPDDSKVAAAQCPGGQCQAPAAKAPQSCPNGKCRKP